MATFYIGFGDALINTLSYIELSRFKMNKFSYDVSEYILLINALAGLKDYNFGPIKADVRLTSKSDLIYLGLTSNDKIERLETGTYRILISNPAQFLMLSLSQLKEKI